MLTKKHTSLLTVLATTSMLVGISANAHASIAPACANPLNKGVDHTCYYDDVDVRIRSEGTILVVNDSAIVLGAEGYSSSLVNDGALIASGIDENIYGILLIDNLSASGSIVNNGIISLVNTGGGTAGGIYGEEDIYGSITNNGLISSIHTGSNYGYNYGIYIDAAITDSASIVNNGTILAGATSTDSYGYSAIGIYANEVDGSITNKGTITALASGVEYSIATGIEASDVNGTINNEGVINVAVSVTDSYVYGAYGIQVDNVYGAITNSGSITVLGVGYDEASSYGIYAHNVYGTINNSGLLQVASISEDADNSAYGIYINDDIDGDIINSGTITVSAVTPNDNASAVGIYTGGDVGGTITNSGTINVLSESTDDFASAYGIRISNELNGSITNSGTIIATGNGSEAEAYGISTGNLNSGASITNTGTITVAGNATDSDGFAVGIGANDFSSDATITNSGTITVTANNPGNGYSLYLISGDGTAENTGILSGNLFLGGSLNMNNSGLIALPSQANSGDAASIGGDYTQGTGGVLSLGVASDSDYTTLDVGGTADFTDSSTLRVRLDAGNSYAGATLTDVITSGDLVHPEDFIVMDNSLAYNFTASVTGDDVSIESTSTGLTTVSDAVAGSGKASASGAATVVDDLLDNGSDEMVDALSALFGDATTEGDVNDAVNQLLPLMSGSTARVSLDNLHASQLLIQSRLDLAAGLSSGDAFVTDRSGWLKPFGSWSDQQDRNGASGYDARTGGLALGADGLLSDNNTRVGAAVIYSRSNVDSNATAASQRARINSYQGVLYGSYNLDKVTSVDVQADIGFNTNDGKRSVAGMTAHSDYNSWSQHIGAGIGRSYALASKTTFIPSLRADFANITTESYSETGAGLFNLNVEDDSTQEFIIGAGGKLQQGITDYAKVSVNAGIGYDVINDPASIDSNFAGGGATFATRGIDPSPWIGQAGVGLTIDQFKGVEITTRYDLEARSDYTNQTGSVRLKMPF